jgi:hypothetical protein
MTTIALNTYTRIYAYNLMSTIAPAYRFTPTFYDHTGAYTLTHAHRFTRTFYDHDCA